MWSALVIPRAPHTSRCLYGQVTPRWAKGHLNNTRTFHSSPSLHFEGKDENEETRLDRRRAQTRALNLEKVKHSPLPLAKFLRLENVHEEKSRLDEIWQELSRQHPEAAKLADKLLGSMPAGVVISEVQRAFPEFKYNKLSDLKAFDTLLQFVDAKDRDPHYDLVREVLSREEKEAAEKLAKERELELKESTLLSPHFPNLYGRTPSSETNDMLVSLDDPSLGPSYDEVTAEIIKKIETGFDPLLKKSISRGEFFAGVNRSDPVAMEKREQLWAKYNQILKLQALGDAAGEKSAEVEPVLEAATNLRYAFLPSALGKYIHFNTREQKKYLPEGWCGKLEHREFVMTKETSLMMRQPTLDLIQKLREAEEASFSIRKAPKPSILYGRAGVGKSAALQLAVYWALNIKNATKWVHGGGIIQKSKLIPGCWDQPYLGVKFLEHMLDAHTDKLKTIPLRTEISLGKFEGKTLFDLVEYGAALHEYSCDVVVYLKRELERVIEYPVLIAIDDYNSLYNYNQRFREPESTHFFPRKLRNRDLTLTRIFMDSHLDPKLVNGTMIGAVSREPSYRHFEPEEHKNSDWIEVQPFSEYETSKVFQHYERTGYVLAQTSSGTREVVRQLTSGQGHEIWRWCKAL